VALLLLVAINAVTVTAMLLLRRRAPEGSYFHDTQQAAGVFTVAGTAYAVLLAFVFLLAFQSYNTARTAGEQEAVTVTALYHDADPFPQPWRTIIHGELVCYGRSVVHQEWPAMKDDHSSAVTQGWLDRLDASFGQTQPTTAKQQNADATWRDLTAQRLDARRSRLQEAGPLIPSLVWILLIVGSIVVLAFTTLFADHRERAVVQAVLMASVTTMLVSGLIMIKFFDDPYANVPGSIKPDAMQRTLRTVAVLPSERMLRPPCGLKGRPLRSTA
jgi:hypothetical protein